MLSAPSAGSATADASGKATILNDDGAAWLGVANLQVTEGNSGTTTTTATFTITRSGNTNGVSTVKYKTSNGTAKADDGDYVAIGTATPVTFAAGETTKTVDVTVNGDATVEKNETFNLALSAATGATIADATGSATIVNDD